MNIAAALAEVRDVLRSIAEDTTIPYHDKQILCAEIRREALVLIEKNPYSPEAKR